jgi:hypothetical protein
MSKEKIKFRVIRDSLILKTGDIVMGTFDHHAHENQKDANSPIIANVWLCRALDGSKGEWMPEVWLERVDVATQE